MFSEDHHPLRVPQTCHIQAYSGKIFAMAPTPAFYIYSYTYEYMFTVLLYIHMWFGLCLGQGLGIVLLSWSLQQSTLPAYVNQGNSRYLMSHTLPCVLCPDSQPGVSASQRTSCTFFYTCIYIYMRIYSYYYPQQSLACAYKRDKWGMCLNADSSPCLLPWSEAKVTPRPDTRNTVCECVLAKLCISLFWHRGTATLESPDGPMFRAPPVSERQRSVHGGAAIETTSHLGEIRGA